MNVSKFLSEGKALKVIILSSVILFIAYTISSKNMIVLSSTKNESQKGISYHTNVIKDTKDNTNFRKVLFTGAESQLVIMSIPPGGEVGKETHKYTEQTLFFLSGKGEGEFDGKKFTIVAGDVVVVVPGTEHNFRNTGTEDLKIYTVYAPPNHIDGRIHANKSDADIDADDEAVGEKPPSD